MLIILAALLAVIVALIPASIVTHFLPPSVHAEDFSGSVWHGSAGRITVNTHDAGALEWRLHPASLLRMSITADLHWVKVGFVVDGAVKINRGDVSARDVTGGGPIEDLRDLGVPAGWQGRAEVNLTQLNADVDAGVLAAVGDVRVTNLAAAQIASGADLGGYNLRFSGGTLPKDDTPGTGGDLAAQLADTGGPLEVQAVIRYAAKERIATLSGTVKERPDAPAPLRSQIDNLAQMRGRDPQGRVPVEFEFTM